VSRSASSGAVAPAPSPDPAEHPFAALAAALHNARELQAAHKRAVYKSFFADY
jgi:hypothetical protein